MLARLKYLSERVAFKLHIPKALKFQLGQTITQPHGLDRLSERTVALWVESEQRTKLQLQA
jgi:hypothetical protein